MIRKIRFILLFALIVSNRAVGQNPYERAKILIEKIELTPNIEIYHEEIKNNLYRKFEETEKVVQAQEDENVDYSISVEITKIIGQDINILISINNSETQEFRTDFRGTVERLLASNKFSDAVSQLTQNIPLPREKDFTYYF